MPSGENRLLAASPILHVQDYSAAIAYYRDKLGFEVSWSADGYQYGAVERDEVEINIHGKMAASDVARLHQTTQDYADIYIYAADVDTLAAEFSANQVEIIFGPADCAYGMRELAIRDLNGYKLVFGQPCTPAG